MAQSTDETYWSWADFAHREIVEGRAKGNRRSLWLRARLQTFLFKLGNFAQTHSAPVLMIGLVILVGCTFGLYNAKLETNPEKLWVEVGGRLEKETAYSNKYGADSLTSYEMIIQTPNRQGADVLTVPALRKHVEFVRKAMEVEVEVFQQKWTINDLCVRPSLPELNHQMKERIVKILPCIVITPLDCFWDGAKIHTQEIPFFSSTISWSKWSPLDFINLIREHLGNNTIDLDKLKSMLNEGGISHGYMKKPCLNPKEQDCPLSAPNKASKKKPDIGQELTGGCTGFAEKFMKWPEELIVGGVQRNKSGVLQSAKALQTIINLLTEEDLYDYWLDTNGYGNTYKVNHIDTWSVEKAKTILQTWQRKFVKVVNEMSSKSSQQNAIAFSTTSFNDLLKDFSTANKGLIAGGYVLMLVYACFTMIRWNSAVQSQGCMGILGVLLVSLSVAAGLGVCSFFGISFNAASTQVLPFLALGLGVDDMFLLSHTYRDLNSKSLRSKENAGYCLSITGVSIMLTSFTNAIAFFMAAIIPIPALRALCIKAGVIVIFNFLAVVTIYPAMIAMDVKRRESQRYDMFCCVKRDSHTRVTQIREDGISYDNSMVTVNHESSSLDEDSSLHQISTASANVSIGQASGDLFVLPGVKLIASANCNFNESLCNGVIGGDLMALPGMSNIVVSVSSGHNRGGETLQTASANVRSNITNNMKGGGWNINASSSAGTSSAKSDKCKDGAKITSSRVNHGCRVGSASMDNLYPAKDGTSKGNSKSWNNNTDKNTRNENNSSGGKKGYAHSSVNISQNNGSQGGKFQISANTETDTRQGESSCSSNAEVILRADQARSSTGQNNSWRNSPSQNGFQKKLAKLSLGYLTKTFYAPLLQKLPVKIMVLFLCVIIFSVAIFGCFQVKDGLDVTDVVPKGTKTSEFLEARYKYFSFYDIVIVTKSDYNYPNGQEKLYQLHKAFAKVDNIVMSEDNALPKFWLMYFRDWLKGLQQAFDSDWRRNAITFNGPSPNATDNGRLAYKLLLQTADQGKFKVRSTKLVDDEGIIHRRGFYSFLRAWYNLDPMGYELSQAQIKPTPEPWKDDVDRKTILPAKQIQYARIPLYLTNLRDTDDYLKTIKQVREICDRFTDAGLPNYPRGVPFTFWEQYTWLRHKLLITISIVLVVSFVVISAVLVNIWAGFIVAVVLVMTTVELYGFLGLAGIKLSVVPAVTLILSIGVGVEFTVHLCMVFVTSVGDRNQRLQQSLEAVLCPVVDGAISTMLGVIMLAGSEFDFVVKYFFYVLAALIVIGFVNGVLFLPVFLSLAGPNQEVIPLQRLSTAASTMSWLGLMPFDRNTCSSVSNLTFDATQQASQRESTTETDDVHLQIVPTGTENCPNDPKGKKWKKNVTPRNYYGKTMDSMTENPKRVFSKPVDRSQPGQTLRNATSIAKLTATATVTVELQQREHPEVTASSDAMVIRSSTPESDLELVDCEEEFV